MPDTSFSWRGLREHLRRYLWIYLLGVALCLVGTGLLWTTTAPRLDYDEVITVFLADTYSNGELLQDVAADMLADAQAVDPAVKQVSFDSLLYDENEYTSGMLLVTRLAVGEGDAFLACQAAAETLVSSQALVHLDDYCADGWLAEYGLEPWYGTWRDEETGESETYLAGLRLDSVDALVRRGAFNNQGALLCVANNGGNVEGTMRALETMMAILTEEDHAGTEAE